MSPEVINNGNGKWFSVDAKSFYKELDRLAEENPEYKIVLEDLKESVDEHLECFFDEETGEEEDFVGDTSRQVVCGMLGQKFAMVADNMFGEAFENLI